MPDYSFSPQFANLANLQPIQPIDVTRGGALQFRALQPIQVLSSQPELIGQSIAGAVQSIGQGALSGITAKWKKEEELAKEQRKYAHEIELEESKQKTKNQNFLDELKLKVASEHGLEADVDKRMSALDEAATRLEFVNPSGNRIGSNKTQDQKPTQVIDGNKPISEQVKEIDFQTPLPEPTPPPKPSVAVTPADEITIPDPNLHPSVQRASTQGAAIPQPTPALTGVPLPTPTPSVTPSVAQSLSPVSPVGAYKLPEQPSDPKAPRNTAGIEFMPGESGQAYDAAARLTTPYWQVIPEQNPSTKKWSLQPKDTSGDVEKLGIDKANLVLAQNKQSIEREKADRERLDAETKKLKEDKQYLDIQKTRLDDTLTNVGLIDQAISLINQNPESVGIITKIYKDRKPLPVIGDVAGWSDLLAFYDYSPTKERLQNIENVSEALEAVKANIGFEKLGELKSLSPTGASGLGSLTEGERKALQSTKGSIEQSQSYEILKSNLYNLRSGVIKSSGNAFMKIREVEPKYVPIQTFPVLEMNPNELNELNSLAQSLRSATDKESTEYKNNVKRFKNLVDKSARIDAFNNNVFGTQ